MSSRSMSLARALFAAACLAAVAGYAAEPPASLKPGQPEKKTEQPGKKEKPTEDDARDRTAAEDAPPAEFLDPGFHGYMDNVQLGRALDSRDPVLLCDLGLLLAEGERVLRRPHRFLSAASLLRAAERAAAERRDAQTLGRLTAAARARGDQESVARLDLARTATRAPRKEESALLVSPERLSVEEFAAYRTVLGEIRRATALDDRRALRQLEIDVHALSGLDEGHYDYLARTVAAALTALPEQTDAQSEVLQKLAHAGRAGSSGRPATATGSSDNSLLAQCEEARASPHGSPLRKDVAVRIRTKLGSLADQLRQLNRELAREWPLPSKLPNGDVGYKPAPECRKKSQARHDLYESKYWYTLKLWQVEPPTPIRGETLALFERARKLPLHDPERIRLTKQFDSEWTADTRPLTQRMIALTRKMGGYPPESVDRQLEWVPHAPPPPRRGDGALLFDQPESPDYVQLYNLMFERYSKQNEYLQMSEILHTGKWQGGPMSQWINKY